MTSGTSRRPGLGAYDPAELEPRWARAWEEAGDYAGDDAPGQGRVPFTVCVPPPNVTGTLHMGHALNATLQDTLVRLKRRQGYAALWVPGTDHAGIGMQAVVERQLRSEGLDRRDLGREAFLERMWAWRETNGEQIYDQFRRIGASLDYRRAGFTMDPGYADAVRGTFVHLYERGLIYRDNYLVNWDTTYQTAISDLEIVNRDEERELLTLRYAFADGDGDGALLVATQRPETVFGDVAVAVHPDSAQASSSIGRHVRVPLTDRVVPVIADASVDPDFGTGALKITPGHAQHDFEIGRAHGLPEPVVITGDGHLADDPEWVPAAYRGLTVADAKRRAVAELEAGGLIAARERYTTSVPYSERSNVVVEPLISRQWFCGMDELAAPAIRAVADGRVTFHPERYGRVYTDWLGQIRPWCISRQLWWGHRIPVWYRGDETWVGAGAPDGDGWTQDPDVLDTWFSSQLWPMATLGWPAATPALAGRYPTQVLSTARDILFLWVARMVMMGEEFLGREPFSDVVVHSTILAADGTRMSKSKGNGVDPMDLIAAHGADATRYGLLAMATTQDVRFSAERIEQGRALALKVWNVAKLILAGTDDDAGGVVIAAPAALADRFVLSRLERGTAQITAHLEAFRFAEAVQALGALIRDDTCDWYVEAAKRRMYAGERDAAVVLRYALERMLGLLGPVMPFVTEELWGQLGDRVTGGGRLTRAPFPRADLALVDDDAERAFDAIRAAVTALRAWRQDAGVAPRERVDVVAEVDAAHPLAGPDAADLLADLGQARLVDGPAPATAPVVRVAGGRLRPIVTVDVARERARLDGLLVTATAELTRARAKLADERFAARAPAALVAAERDKAARYEAERDHLAAARAALDAPSASGS